MYKMKWARFDKFDKEVNADICNQFTCCDSRAFYYRSNLFHSWNRENP